MKKMKKMKNVCALLALVASAGVAQATLILQSNGLEVLDTNTNLLWLKDWNANPTNGGLNNWADSKAWAEAVTVETGGTDLGEWRLPEIGEYGDLFTAYGDLTAVTEFMNVQSNDYWSGTEITPGDVAWVFNPDSGNQDVDVENGPFFAVAVRPGDVAAPMPEPQTLGLVGLALGAAAFALRRRPG